MGCPRSGTTLLQQILDAHSRVAITPETHFMKRFWLNRKRYGNLAEDANYYRLIDEIIAMPEFEEMQLERQHFRERALEIERSYARVFGLLLEQFGELQKVEIVGEKTPHHLKFLPTIKEFFPAARFINIVRDPRAVVNSWRSVPWSTGSVGGDANIWRRDMGIIRESPPEIKSVLLTIHYEELVRSPGDVLRQVCSFIGVDFQEAILEFYKQDSFSVNVEREPWKANVKTALNPASISRWKTELSESMVREIEGIVWPEMRRLGYQTVSQEGHLLLTEARRQFKLLGRNVKQKVKSILKK